MTDSKKLAAVKGEVESPVKKDKTLDLIEDKDDFIHRFRTLYNSEIFSDIVLVVGDTRFYAHKILLVTASEVFEAMLSEARWQESSQNEVCLTEDEDCVSVFPDFLKYIYCGSVELTTSMVHKLLILADKYGIHVLHKTCVEYMSRHIVTSPDTNRTLTWYHYAKITNGQHLQEKCLAFILSNFSIIQKAPDWLDLTPSVMVEFLQSSEMVVESEFQLWMEVQRWIKAVEDPDIVLEKLKAVLPHMRFSMMTPADLLKMENSDLYNEHTELFGNRLMRAYRGHSLHSSDLMSHTREEPYRNYYHKLYSICDDLKLRNYIETPKTESQLVASMVVPIHLKPFPVQIKDDDSLSFDVAFYPQGFYQAHPLYGMYMSRQSDETVLNVSRICTSSQHIVDVDITFVIYAYRDNMKYIAHSRTVSHQFSNKSRHGKVENVISVENLKSKKSPYLVGKSFESKIFLKIQNIQLEEKKEKKE
ncbi:BTB/POZ domain-containing protein 17-like [Mizuhopecten yessoensis]|uniref:BTB/POZ domain-containing protein 17 n=1 Tax=Mizuhopecten yessoensis TaxID=6573 RepID=A0A210Q9W1_MIZYE|nr:BTB/POZ domain-containing protein 17-like [Mizuhopecten yessoensis]XP_021363636.1 BTB/POZ domain-containing protein 17-like [Mizuhopecten yessoensis]XP_021363638.1 BTB/POZ domain-containing protein 17-like [Mizuhopecten yessoensis]XP_021363639.1 BTB/POZ domain-containing protein 17-like [Mizuhopecten yessoensis]XP_021363640.1 BTB/POZ domain-containing protein 17-like [Mizuhopecten yessoensis]OWF45521.1 BTB/POZ domain-containing protein 17 [Mizuhopecten yessoensis]